MQHHEQRKHHQLHRHISVRRSNAVFSVQSSRYRSRTLPGNNSTQNTAGNPARRAAGWQGHGIESRPSRRLRLHKKCEEKVPVVLVCVTHQRRRVRTLLASNSAVTRVHVGVRGGSMSADTIITVAMPRVICPIGAEENSSPPPSCEQRLLLHLVHADREKQTNKRCTPRDDSPATFDLKSGSAHLCC